MEFCSAVMSFFVIGLLCMSRKNAFIANQKISLAESYTNFTQSRFFTHKNFFCTCLSSLSAKNSHFHKSKAFFCTNLSLLLSKVALFHPPSPIRTTLNLLSTKEHGCSFNLRSNSLRCNAGASHRFKSLPAIPGDLQLSA